MTSGPESYFLGMLIRSIGVPKERGVWNSPGGRKDKVFCPSVFLTRTSCRKTTLANGYYGAWPGWVVSISVLPLTILSEVIQTKTNII